MCGRTIKSQSFLFSFQDIFYFMNENVFFTLRSLVYVCCVGRVSVCDWIACYDFFLFAEVKGNRICETPFDNIR